MCYYTHSENITVNILIEILFLYAYSDELSSLENFQDIQDVFSLYNVEE